MQINQPVSHLYPQDTEVWHWWVIHGHTGVSAIWDTQKDFGGRGGGAVVQHLTQCVDVNVFGSEASPDGVVGARHALNAVCNIFRGWKLSKCLILLVENTKISKNQTCAFTSINVGVRLVGPQEHGLAWLQHDVVEKKDGEAADVSRILGMEAEQQVAIAA